MAQHKKSPLKDKPLRNPGQSLEQRRRDLFDDKLFSPLLYAAFLIVLTGLEWWRHYNPAPPNPKLYTVAALIALAYAIWKFWRHVPELKRLKQAIEGEKAVGQFLERLRANGYWIFHDVLGPNFNLDHVLIGPAGIFTVETKTLSKPAKGEAIITFDGEKIWVQGTSMERDPIIQAKAQANWLRNLLAETTGRKPDVHAVVVFPGWFIKSPPGANRDLWVLEPKALPAFLEKTRRTLEIEDISLFNSRLSQYVRGEEKARESTGK